VARSCSRWTAGTERLGPDDRFRPPDRSRSVVEEAFSAGAIITGRRTFDIAQGWGGRHPIGVPFFLLTHRPPERWVGPGTERTVVTEGIERALEQAKAVAGGRAIAVSGADVAQQYLRAGLLDGDSSERGPCPSRRRCGTLSISEIAPLTWSASGSSSLTGSPTSATASSGRTSSPRELRPGWIQGCHPVA
jgi:hypothetical protein